MVAHGSVYSLLRQLPLGKRVLGVVLRERTFGVAVSDEYLAHAVPLSLPTYDGMGAEWWRDLARDQNARLVLVSGEACSERQALRSCGVSITDFDAAPGLKAIVDRALERPELFKFLSQAPPGASISPSARLRSLRSLNELPPDLHAAVLLNEALLGHEDGEGEDSFG
ncbi:hypothetical protein M885DRAFT_542289 [Pelagophyceae sp. CCMP2097]|nr:hypothetical protein M885DRAFT_542289 [Pelagophyceae sp. CCMP2097]